MTKRPDFKHWNFGNQADRFIEQVATDVFTALRDAMKNETWVSSVTVSKDGRDILLNTEVLGMDKNAFVGPKISLNEGLYARKCGSKKKKIVALLREMADRLEQDNEP